MALVAAAALLAAPSCSRGGDRPASTPTVRVSPPTAAVASPGVPLTGVAEACTRRPRVGRPSWFPADLPLPAGTFVTRELPQGNGLRGAELIVPTTQIDFAKFLLDRLPASGWALGYSDAEPGKEIEQAFSKGSAQGFVKALVANCSPPYQDVYFTYRAG